MTYDPLIARIFVFTFNSLKVVITTIFCLKSGEPLSAIPEATNVASPGMLVLSIHLNNLVTWAIAVFSVSLTSDKLTKTNAFNYYLTLTGIDAALSCLSGFFIGCYLIKQLELALSSQILQVFDETSTAPQREQARAHSKQSAMSKLVLLLIFLSLAFAVCVSTVLRLNSDERLSTLMTFLVATLADTMAFRPVVIVFIAFYEFLEMRAFGWVN